MMALLAGGAACAGDEDDSDSAGAPEPTTTSSAVDDDTDGATFVAVDIDWENPPDSLPAGKTTVTLRNSGQIEHSLVFEDTDFRVVAAAGEEKTGEIELEAGEVYFFCDIPGHEDAGMSGELTVG